MGWFSCADEITVKTNFEKIVDTEPIVAREQYSSQQVDSFGYFLFRFDGLVRSCISIRSRVRVRRGTGARVGCLLFVR